MPIYEYERSDGTAFEIRQSIKDDALEVCPETGLECWRKIGAPLVRFNTGGFYTTDYKSSIPTKDEVKGSS